MLRRSIGSTNIWLIAPDSRDTLGRRLAPAVVRRHPNFPPPNTSDARPPTAPGQADATNLDHIVRPDRKEEGVGYCARLGTSPLLCTPRACHLPRVTLFSTRSRNSAGAGATFRRCRPKLHRLHAAAMLGATSLPPSRRACKCSAVHCSHLATGFEIRYCSANDAQSSIHIKT
jgi:hypothetical protein